MRFIQTSTLDFVEYADESQAPKYGILSHRWQSEEVLYEDMITRTADQKQGFAKLREFCRLCYLDGLSLAWIDTCCINKSSSAELSEAMNSMYRWYKASFKCYAYLCDVRSLAPSSNIDEDGQGTFESSEWFERGWTLQELIAPSNVYFYSVDWKIMGAKLNLSERVSSITRIPADVLCGEDPRNYSIAQRMSWAAERKTTRVEDKSYCLMGLFDVNMPMLYGEGEKAFIRLQEEISRYSSDQSIFAWPGLLSDYENSEMYAFTEQTLNGLFATSAAAFTYCGNVFSGLDRLAMNLPRKVPTSFSQTNLGLSVELELASCGIDVYEAKLDCYAKVEGVKAPISLFLRQTDLDGQFVRQAVQGHLTRESRFNLEYYPTRLSIVQAQRTMDIAPLSRLQFDRKPACDFLQLHQAKRPYRNISSSESAFSSVDIRPGSLKCLSVSWVLKTNSWNMNPRFLLIRVHFDFSCNPTLHLLYKTTSDVQGLFMCCEDGPDESKGSYSSFWKPEIQRKVCTEHRNFHDGIDFIFPGHRSEGILLWLRHSNIVIDLRRRSFVRDETWILDVQKVEKSIASNLESISSRQLPNSELWSSPSWALEMTSVQGTKFGRGTSQSEIQNAHWCPICDDLLVVPIKSSCGHTFCQNCIPWADLALTSVHYDWVTPRHGEVTNKIGCPLCGYQDCADLDLECQNRIRALYPIQYQILSWSALKTEQDSFPLFETVVFWLGNTHKVASNPKVSFSDPSKANRHDWTFFVRPTKSGFIGEVTVYLHTSFRNNEIPIFHPPYEVRRFGWGEFEIIVDVILKPGYQFVHSQAKSSGEPNNKLQLSWVLNFAGDGDQRSLKVLIKRTKSTLTANDHKLQSQVNKLLWSQSSYLNAQNSSEMVQ